MIVTAHAMLRYLERVVGTDVRALRAAFHCAHPEVTEEVGEALLVSWLETRDGGACVLLRSHLEEICAEASRLGAHALVRDGVSYVFSGGALVTVLSKDMRLRARTLTPRQWPPRVCGWRARRHHQWR